MNKLQINPPEGYEIDQDKSDLSKGIVHFKKSKKVLNYKDVARRLFCTSDEPDHYDYDSGFNKIGSISPCVANSRWTNKKLLGLNLLSTTKSQLESILALNKLCNVAKYLNGEWLPKNNSCQKYVLMIDASNEITTDLHNQCTLTNVYFKTRKLAQQAIEILGEEEIRKALTLNH